MNSSVGHYDVKMSKMRRNQQKRMKMNSYEVGGKPGESGILKPSEEHI